MQRGHRRNINVIVAKGYICRAVGESAGNACEAGEPYSDLRSGRKKIGLLHFALSVPPNDCLQLRRAISIQAEGIRLEKHAIAPSAQGFVRCADGETFHPKSRSRRPCTIAAIVMLSASIR